MPPAAAAKPVAPRKRNRKRKRRAASSSDSSSDSSSSSESDSPPKVTKTLPAKAPVQESSESESEPSSSSSDSDSDTDISPVKPTTLPDQAKPILPTRNSCSPSPPITAIPSFIPPTHTTGTESDAIQNEQVMKDRFRKFWMSSVADGFKDDLEEIRKEPNLGSSRLGLLIDSLASGADVFTSSAQTGTSNDINEMEVVLE